MAHPKHFLLFAMATMLSIGLKAQWTNIGQAGVSTTDIPWISLAFDTSNVPFIAYEATDNNGKLAVKKWNNGSWISVGSAGVTSAGVNEVSLALGPDNLPYVAFNDDGAGGSGTHQVSVMKYYNGSWVTVGNADFSPGAVFSVSLKFDHSGNLYIAYVDINSGKALVEKFNGSTWVMVGTPPAMQVSGFSLSLAFDDNDVPHIAFADGDSMGSISVLKYNSGAWSYLGHGGFTAAGSDYPSLAFAGGTAFVAFTDGGDSMKVSAKKFAGGNWIDAGSPGFSTGTNCYSVSLASNQQGDVFVAYGEGPDGKMSVSKYNGTGWNYVGAAGFTPDPISYGSLAIDKPGNLYVAYDGASATTGAPVMKFPAASLAIENHAPVTESFTVYPNPFTSSLAITLTGERPTEAAFSIYNTLGQTIYHQTETNVATGYIKMQDMSSLPNGLYFVEVTTNGGRLLKRVVKE